MEHRSAFRWVSALLLWVGILVSVSLAADCTTRAYQAAVTLSPVPTTSPTPTPTSTPTPVEATQPQLLGAYQEVLNSSKTALTETRKSMDSLLTWVGIAFGISAGATVFNAWQTSRFSNQLMSKVDSSLQELASVATRVSEIAQASGSAVQEAERTLQGAQTAFTQAAQAISEVTNARLQLVGVQEEMRRATTKITEVQKTADDLQAILVGLQEDADWYQDVMFLLELGQHVPFLYHTQEDVQMDAARAVAGLLNHQRPIMRYQVMRELRRWAEMPDRQGEQLAGYVLETVQAHLSEETEPMIKIEGRAAMLALGKASDPETEQSDESV